MKLRILLALVPILGLPFLGFAAKSPAFPAELDQIVDDVSAYQTGANLQALRRMEEIVRQATYIPSVRIQAETSLVRVLTNPNATFEAKRFACQQWALIGSDASLPVISALLQKEQTAGIACLALSTHSSPKVNAILCEALPVLTGAARAQVINLLGERRDVESVPTLINLARHPDPVISAATIAALGKIANPAACQALASLRGDKDPVFAHSASLASLQAAEQLSASDGKEARVARTGAVTVYNELLEPSRPAYVRRAAFEALLKMDADGGEKRIMEILRGSDATLKPAAIAGIRSLKSRSVSRKFAAELPKLQVQDQVLLLETLAVRQDSAAHSALVDALSAENAAVRCTAITCLGKLTEPSVVPELVKCIGKTTDPEESQLLHQTLCTMSGGEKIDRALVRELKKAAAAQPASTSVLSIEAALIEILAKRGAQLAVPVLLVEATSDRKVNTAAFQALGAVAGAEDAPKVLDALYKLGEGEQASRSEAENAARVALSKMPPAQASELVCKAIDADSRGNSDTENLRRRSLISLLPSCPDAKALEVLKSACANKNPKARTAAIRALAQWPDLSAWDPLAAVYAEATNTTEDQRALALRGLVRLVDEANAKPDDKLIDRYKQLLDGARSDQDRKLILGALSGVVHPQALPLVYPLLEQPGIRAEAEIAIKKIAESIKGKNPQAAQEALQRLQKKP